MTATDPHPREAAIFPVTSARREWNVLPVTSVIEVRHTVAPGCALMQKRCGSDAITIVTGGDAGTAEGDFASCLIWSTRPGNEVPVLILVQNNHWGISTPASEVHVAEKERSSIAARRSAFPGEIVDGNDPIASWHAIRRAMNYCRRGLLPAFHPGGAGISTVVWPFVLERRAARQGRARLHRVVRAKAAGNRRARSGDD